MPMINPDGIEISKAVAGWQANAAGVDLNHNYDAGFQVYKKMAEEQGIIKGCKTRFPGKRCESEPETKAVADFTRSMKFSYVVAFHSQGKVIYWKYLSKQPPGAKQLGLKMSNASGYPLDETDGLSSYSGYKDWFIEKFNRPGFTVEVGEGQNPLPLSMLDEIYKEVLGILLLPATEV